MDKDNDFLQTKRQFQEEIKNLGLSWLGEAESDAYSAVLVAGLANEARILGKTLADYMNSWNLRFEYMNTGTVETNTPGTNFAQRLVSVENSPEFKKFFGDSKVVDENGEPMLVYHGGNIGIEEFRTSNKWGYGGTYFSSNKNVAKIFARNNGKVYETYVSFQNPLIVDAQNGFWDSIPRPDIMPGSGNADTQEIVVFARDNGYDGVIVKNVQEHGGLGDDVIAFSPEQIKSLNNRGTWNVSDPNIYHQSSTPITVQPVKMSDGWSKYAEMTQEQKLTLTERILRNIAGKSFKTTKGETIRFKSGLSIKKEALHFIAGEGGTIVDIDDRRLFALENLEGLLKSSNLHSSTGLDEDGVYTYFYNLYNTSDGDMLHLLVTKENDAGDFVVVTQYGNSHNVNEKIQSLSQNGTFAGRNIFSYYQTESATSSNDDVTLSVEIGSHPEGGRRISSFVAETDNTPELLNVNTSRVTQIRREDMRTRAKGNLCSKNARKICVIVFWGIKYA